MLQNVFSKKKYFYAAGFLAVLILSLIILPVDSTADTGDGVQHYYFAKNAFKHPANFLDLWAKPLFTFFAAPFAQFGIKGMHFFNILCAVFSGLLCVSVAKKLKLGYSWLAFFILLFTPIYFHLICSAMTELFFGLVFILCVYLFLHEKIFLCAITASFLPFARQEGYLFLPVLFVVLLIVKRYRVLPFLFTGVLLFSLAGYFFKNDFLWLIHDDPYKGASAIYGHGPLFHFALNSEIIFGLAIQAMIIAGTFWLCITLVRELKNRTWMRNNNFIAHFFIIAGFFFVFFAAHSIMWWRGSNGSLGLLRVMACIAPPGALLALTGIEAFLKLIKNKNFAISTALLFAALCFVILVTRSGFPPETGREDKLTQDAADWLKKNNYLDRKIIFSSPYLPFYLDLNPAEKEKTQELNSVEKFEKGNIIVWDSHFGPNEDGFPESKFRNDSAFVVLDHLMPAENFATLGNKNYEIYVLERK